MESKIRSQKKAFETAFKISSPKKYNKKILPPQVAVQGSQKSQPLLQAQIVATIKAPPQEVQVGHQDCQKTFLGGLLSEL